MRLMVEKVSWVEDYGGLKVQIDILASADLTECLEEIASFY